MARFHEPNPLDLMFFAFDRAAKRLGFRTSWFAVCLELGGWIDLEGLKAALAALHRIYPAAASRLEYSPVLGRPRWRLDADPPDLDRVVRVHHLSPPTREELHRRVENLIAGPIDLVNLPPVQFHVFRDLDSGDLLVMCVPHALMDGRGGFLIVEELDRLYRERPDPASLRSAGDESRDDFARVTAQVPPGRKAWTYMKGVRSTRPPRSPDARLTDDGGAHRGNLIRCSVRHLSPEQSQQAREAARRVCPFARFGVYLRACAIRALYRLLPSPTPANSTCSLPYIIESRDRPYRGPVCRNLFSAHRIFVPTALAADLVAVAKKLNREIERVEAPGFVLAPQITARSLSRLPLALAAEITRVSMVAENAAALPGGFAKPPSLSMGFMRAFTREMPTFCGTRLSGAYAFRPLHPLEGWSIQVFVEQDQLSICTMFLESFSDSVNAFLEAFAATLLKPG